MIHSVRFFAGTVHSASVEFQGLQAPASLTLIEHDAEYECKFVFFVGGSLPLTVRATKSAGTALQGVAQDPRGWDVSFKAQLAGGRLTGLFSQPHDRGTFTLEAV